MAAPLANFHEAFMRRALELARRAGPLALLKVRDGELGSDLGLQGVAGEALAEVLERTLSTVPIFQRNQCRCAIVLSRCPY